MSTCTDRQIGDMLHAYELGILDDHDKRIFEEHLLTCDHCLQKAQKLLPAVAMIKRHPKVREVALEAIRQTESEERSRRSIVRRLFETPLVRYAAMAALLVVVTIPVLRLSLFDDRADQEIFLSPTRSTEQATIDLEVGGRVAIAFVVSDASQATVCNVAVYSQAGDTIFFEPAVGSFNESGQATLELDATAFVPGIYILSASGCTPPADSVRLYYFLAR